MNRWTEDVLEYLRGRTDRAARALLARSDAPRAAPEKKIRAVALAKARAAEAERAEERAIRRMHAEVWLWSFTHTRDAGAPHGRCDCGCGYAFRHDGEGELDHWKGRRGPEAHTRANGWRLRSDCHEKKDGRRKIPAGEPPFNARRRAYCERAGIAFIPRKELHR
jgi:hypothetical protein